MTAIVFFMIKIYQIKIYWDANPSLKIKGFNS